MTLLTLLVPLLLPDWMDPEYLIHALGNWALWGVALVLIIECSIFPILPGDTLFMRSELVMKDPAGFSHFKVEARIGRRVTTVGKLANFWFDMSKPFNYPG